MLLIENKRKRKFHGFTLVELLLVVAIVAIISTLVITQFADTSKKTRATVSQYNTKELQKTIHDFNSLYSVYPSCWHTGLDSATAPTMSAEGLSLQTALNMAAAADGTISPTAIANNYDKGYQVTTPGANVKALTTGQARALRENGIHQFAVNGYRPVSASGVDPTKADVSDSLACWVLTGGKDLYTGGTAAQQPDWSYVYTLGTTAVTIDGRKLSTWNSWGQEAVVLVFCTKEVAWESVLKGDPDGTGAGEYLKKSDIKIDAAPSDLNASEASAFPYYIAAFYLSPDQIGSNAGYSCKLLGILDGGLNPVRK